MGAAACLRDLPCCYWDRARGRLCPRLCHERFIVQDAASLLQRQLQANLLGGLLP